MARWEVEYTDEFGDWWNGLTEAEQESVDASVHLLEEHVPLADRLYDERLAAPRKEGVKRDG